MKVSGGLVGITLNPGARNKFFLISPELAKIATEAQQMVGISSNARTHHYSLSSSITRRQENSIEKLTATVRSFTNPFSKEGDNLFNLVTKVVMPQDVTTDLCSQSEIGYKLFEDFLKERNQNKNINIWSPMKKK